MHPLIALFAYASLVDLVSSQFPPKPQGLTILQSKFHENVTISYKEVRLLYWYSSTTT